MPDEVYRTEWRGNLAGQYRENVMFFKCAGITAGDPFDIANDIVNAIDTNFKPLFMDCLPSDYAIDSIRASRVLPVPATYALLDYAPMSELGSISENAVSEQLCPCITLIPPMDVPSAGRIFMPAVAKSSVNLNQFTAGYVTLITTLITAMQGGVSFHGGTLELCIFSRKLQTASIISTFHLSPVLGYQRRRSTPIGS